MQNNAALAGKTIYVTGTQKVQTITELVERYGGEIKYFPLLAVQECRTTGDADWLQKLALYDWLIFTSQNAVSSFIQKLERHPVKVVCRIAAVGVKTKAELERNGFSVDFVPTIFSADVFVKEFPQVAGNGRYLFLKGSLAKNTIHDALQCDEWTVYETVPLTTYVQALEESLLQAAEPVVVFASPSAVEVYAQHVVSAVDWHDVTVASIGHVTTAALRAHGAQVAIQPESYTMQAVIEQLIGG